MWLEELSEQKCWAGFGGKQGHIMSLLIFHHRDTTKEENNRTEFCANKGFFTSYAERRKGGGKASKLLPRQRVTFSIFFAIKLVASFHQSLLFLPAPPTLSSNLLLFYNFTRKWWCSVLRFQSLTSRSGNNLCFYHGQAFTVFAYVILDYVEQRNENSKQ